MGDTPRPRSRLLAWNGLQLSVPISWEVIISGPCHLLFENDFQPLMELRWQRNDKRTSTSKPEKIVKKLGKELQLPVVEVPLPEALQQLSNRYRTIGLSWQPTHQLSGLLALCPMCDTLLFCRFYPHRQVSISNLAGWLNTLQCHPAEEKLTPWSIQDFSLRLPNSFSLVDYTIAAGLTRLSFLSDNLSLQTCRLAPATDRLAHDSLENILCTLHDRKGLHCHMEDDGCACVCSNSPSILRQVRSRLRRKKPFTWSRIWHQPENNRLLAVVLESIRPIPPDISRLICEHYEIVPNC